MKNTSLEYTKKVKEHFLHPKNMGAMKNPDVQAEVINPVCGDRMKVFLKIENRKLKNNKTEKIIKDAKFQTFGCVAAIASSDSVCDIVKGKTISQALKITKNDILNKLGGLPQAKVHCSLLGQDALQEALKKYSKKQ